MKSNAFSKSTNPNGSSYFLVRHIISLIACIWIISSLFSWLCSVQCFLYSVGNDLSEYSIYHRQQVVWPIVFGGSWLPFVQINTISVLLHSLGIRRDFSQPVYVFAGVFHVFRTVYFSNSVNISFFPFLLLFMSHLRANSASSTFFICLYILLCPARCIHHYRIQLLFVLFYISLFLSLSSVNAITGFCYLLTFFWQFYNCSYFLVICFSL